MIIEIEAKTENAVRGLKELAGANQGKMGRLRIKVLRMGSRFTEIASDPYTVQFTHRIFKSIPKSMINPAMTNSYSAAITQHLQMVEVNEDEVEVKIV